MGKFLKLIIITGVIIHGIVALLMMFLHITYLPNTFNFLIREIILLVGSIVFFELARKNQLKYMKISAAFIIIISLFNLIGFNIMVMLF